VFSSRLNNCYISTGYTAGIENKHRAANGRILHLAGIAFRIIEYMSNTGLTRARCCIFDYFIKI
jgi:hypothetical protein